VPCLISPSKSSLIKNGRNKLLLCLSVSTNPVIVVNGRSYLCAGCVTQRLYPGGVLIFQFTAHLNTFGLCPYGTGYFPKTSFACKTFQVVHH
jgi:hypothetical protein